MSISKFSSTYARLAAAPAALLAPVAAFAQDAATTAARIQLIYDGALAASKLDRSTAPITLARQMTAELVASLREQT